MSGCGRLIPTRCRGCSGASGDTTRFCRARTPRDLHLPLPLPLQPFRRDGEHSLLALAGVVSSFAGQLTTAARRIPEDPRRLRMWADTHIHRTIKAALAGTLLLRHALRHCDGQVERRCVLGVLALLPAASEALLLVPPSKVASLPTSLELDDPTTCYIEQFESATSGLLGLLGEGLAATALNDGAAVQPEVAPSAALSTLRSLLAATEDIDTMRGALPFCSNPACSPNSNTACMRLLTTTSQPAPSCLLFLQTWASACTSRASLTPCRH